METIRIRKKGSLRLALRSHISTSPSSIFGTSLIASVVLPVSLLCFGERKTICTPTEHSFATQPIHTHPCVPMPPAHHPNQPSPAASSHGTTYSSMFLGAPFSKLVAAFTVIAYLSMNTQHKFTLSSLASGFEFDAVRIRERGETFRYFTSKATFGSTGELVIGTLFLTYLMRKFEREMGTRKMIIFCSLMNLASIATESVLVVHTSLVLPNLQYSGPYPLMGALFSLYHRYTPRLHPRFFSFWGIHFSEKIFHYAWLLQIATSDGWDSTFAIGMGWLLSLMYEVALPPAVRKLDLIPDRLANLAGSFTSRFLEPLPRILVPQSTGRRGGGGSRGTRHAQPQGGNAAAAGAAAAGGANLRPTAVAQRPTPDPSAIEQLTNMGFSRSQVVEALQSTNNDVHRAAERLLIQQGAH